MWDLLENMIDFDSALSTNFATNWIPSSLKCITPSPPCIMITVPHIELQINHCLLDIRIQVKGRHSGNAQST